MRQLISVGIFILMLAGCATQQKQGTQNLTSSVPANWKATKQKLSDLNSYVITGKAAFNNGGRGGSAAMRWEQHALSKYTIELNAPLSSGAIRIAGEPNVVSLMQPGGELAVAKTPESLLKKALGMEIPVSGLIYWVKGIDAPGIAPTRMMFDQSKHLGLLEQDGWIIKYEDYKDVNGYTLPEKVTLENGQLRLKFIFSQWVLQHSADGNKPSESNKSERSQENKQSSNNTETG